MTDGDHEICGAECRDGSPCQNPPIDGADRCRMHGGAGSGAPEGNGNNEKHGLYAERESWFDRHREECEELVRALTASYLEDAPFGWSATAKVDQLTEIAIDQVRLRHSNEWLDEFLSEQTVSVTENGREITRLEENPAHMPRDRIKRTNAKLLKELGVLSDPDSAQAEATATLAEVIDNA